MTDSTTAADTNPPSPTTSIPAARALQAGAMGAQPAPSPVPRDQSEVPTDATGFPKISRELLAGQPAQPLDEVVTAEHRQAMAQVVDQMTALLGVPVERVQAIADEAAGNPVSGETGKHLFTAAVDVVDVLADVAHGAFFEGELPADGAERDAWRNVVRAVRTAAEPYTYPTADAYEAACKALESYRQAEQVQRARARQLASLAQELYVRLRAREADYWATTGNRIPEAAQDYLDDIREQLDSTLCTGEHAEGQPCIDFRSVS